MCSATIKSNHSKTMGNTKVTQMKKHKHDRCWNLFEAVFGDEHFGPVDCLIIGVESEILSFSDPLLFRDKVEYVIEECPDEVAGEGKHKVEVQRSRAKEAFVHWMLQEVTFCLWFVCFPRHSYMFNIPHAY